MSEHGAVDSIGTILKDIDVALGGNLEPWCH